MTVFYVVCENKMVRLTILVAICVFCAVGGQEVYDTFEADLRTVFCTDFDCGDVYEPVCIFDENLQCYETLKNNCDVMDLWCDYIPFSKIP